MRIIKKNGIEFTRDRGYLPEQQEENQLDSMDINLHQNKLSLYQNLMEDR